MLKPSAEAIRPEKERDLALSPLSGLSLDDSSPFQHNLTQMLRAEPALHELHTHTPTPHTLTQTVAVHHALVRRSVLEEGGWGRRHHTHIERERERREKGEKFSYGQKFPGEDRPGASVSFLSHP